jgi:excinuclease UvrABC ATPase subunit
VENALLLFKRAIGQSKLGTELQHLERGTTIYFFNEPTTGLQPSAKLHSTLRSRVTVRSKAS